MNLYALRTDIAAKLTAALGSGSVAAGSSFVGQPVTVLTHEGKFDLDALKQCAAKAPALVVAIDRVDSRQMHGALAASTASVVITCITKNRAGKPRDTTGLILVQETLRLIHTTDFEAGEACVSRADNVIARNWYSEQARAAGCNLWGIAFEIQVDLLPLVSVTDDFYTLSAQWDLYPRNDEDDLGDLPEASDTLDLEP